MQILIATDKYKGSLTANEVGQSIKSGLQSSRPDLTVRVLPLADGGDGTLAVIHHSLGGSLVQTTILGPLARERKSSYLLYDDRAFIELALASGIALIDQSEYNPLKTTTLGTGQLMLDALQSVDHLVLGLGGSCTNDAGLGICYALGAKFLDAHGKTLIPSGGNLLDIKKIDLTDVKKPASLLILCDVVNPMYGQQGAAYTYAPQKGATPAEVEFLDRGLRHIANLIKETTGVVVDDLIGGGAAGAISAGLYGLLDARLISGFDYLNEIMDIENQIKAADLVITGEGRLDEQSFQGKVPGKILELCRRYSVPCHFVVGGAQLPTDFLSQTEGKQIYTVTDLALDLDDAMTNCSTYLKMIGSKMSEKF